MPGTHYTLDRDLKNPMDVVKEKACKRCQVVKPNTFAFFTTKKWRTNHETTTSDVCLKCMGNKMSEKAAERRREKVAYEEHKIQETIRKFKQGAAERAAKEVDVPPSLDQGRKESDPG